MLLLLHLNAQQLLMWSDIIKKLQLNFYLTSAVSDLLATGIFNLATPAIAF